jgi:hypothetical protein
MIARIRREPKRASRRPDVPQAFPFRPTPVLEGEDARAGGAISPEFYNAIPAALRRLILELPVLPSEDSKVYRGLLIELWELLRPKDALRWLDLKKLVDLIWEGLRLGRIKTEIIIAAQKKSLSSLLLSMTNERVLDSTPSGNVTQAEEDAVSYFTDPVAKKELQALIAKFNYSKKTIDAVAFLQHANEMATLEKIQMSNEARQVVLRRQFEEQREILKLNSAVSTENAKKARQLPPHAGNNDEKDEADDDKEEAA